MLSVIGKDRTVEVYGLQQVCVVTYLQFVPSDTRYLSWVAKCKLGLISCRLLHSFALHEWESLSLQLIFHLASTKQVPVWGQRWKSLLAERLRQVEIRSGGRPLFCRRRRLRWIERGRWIIKEVCSVLTRPLCSQHLHFAVSCGLVTGHSSFSPMCLCVDYTASGSNECHYCDRLACSREEQTQ